MYKYMHELCVEIMIQAYMYVCIWNGEMLVALWVITLCVVLHAIQNVVHPYIHINQNVAHIICVWH